MLPLCSHGGLAAPNNTSHSRLVRPTPRDTPPPRCDGCGFGRGCPHEPSQRSMVEVSVSSNTRCSSWRPGNQRRPPLSSRLVRATRSGSSCCSCTQCCEPASDALRLRTHNHRCGRDGFNRGPHLRVHKRRVGFSFITREDAYGGGRRHGGWSRHTSKQHCLHMQASRTFIWHTRHPPPASSIYTTLMTPCAHVSSAAVMPAPTHHAVPVARWAGSAATATVQCHASRGVRTSTSVTRVASTINT